jgi:ankyrin repeat protein
MVGGGEGGVGPVPMVRPVALAPGLWSAALMTARPGSPLCMTSLHAYFHNRDQATFQRQLSTALLADVNARDWLGRTVLHLACAASARASTEYVRMLLAHPRIDLNLQDAESHWTALHRALYNGNITAAYVAFCYFGATIPNSPPFSASFCCREATLIPH